MDLDLLVQRELDHNMTDAYQARHETAIEASDAFF